jgi:hypothetical protein
MPPAYRGHSTESRLREGHVYAKLSSSIIEFEWERRVIGK